MLIIPWLFRISPGVSGKAENCHKVEFWIIVSGVLPVVPQAIPFPEILSFGNQCAKQSHQHKFPL